MPFLERSQIGQHKFRINHLDVANWINRRADVMNVAVFETAHDLYDGIYFADMTEELITETFPRARALHESGNIEELNRSRNDFLRVRYLG